MEFMLNQEQSEEDHQVKLARLQKQIELAAAEQQLLEQQARTEQARQDAEAAAKLRMIYEKEYITPWKMTNKPAIVAAIGAGVVLMLMLLTFIGNACNPRPPMPIFVRECSCHQIIARPICSEGA